MQGVHRISEWITRLGREDLCGLQFTRSFVLPSVFARILSLQIMGKEQPEVSLCFMTADISHQRGLFEN